MLALSYKSKMEDLRHEAGKMVIAIRRIHLSTFVRTLPTRFKRQIRALYPDIQPAVNQVGLNLGTATKPNAKIYAALLRRH
jgi:hypothetical protein